MIRKSRFDNSIMCYEAGDDAPQRLRDTLRDRGLGFALFGEDVATPMIVIDAAAGLSDEQMIAVEAHEVGHILTGRRRNCRALCNCFAPGDWTSCFSAASSRQRHRDRRVQINGYGSIIAGSRPCRR